MNMTSPSTNTHLDNDAARMLDRVPRGMCLPIHMCNVLLEIFAAQIRERHGLGDPYKHNKCQSSEAAGHEAETGAAEEVQASRE